MPIHLNRRQFVTGAAALAGTLASRAYGDEQPKPKPASPNDRPRIAHIGLGNIGSHNAKIILDLDRSDYVAICDIDKNRTDEWAAKITGRGKPKPDTYQDFRKVLERDDIDAVWISTPDHWHSLITIYACMAGKDVFVEKPISHNIHEGRAMVNAARKYNRIVQAGTQQRSGPHLKAGCEFVRAGNLGKVGLCKTWNVGHQKNLGHPPDGQAPEGVDYDMWLGPAPRRPFNPNRFHYEWRWFWDYAGGKCTDWGIHLIDMIHWGMGVDAPLAVSSAGQRNMLDDNCETPDTQMVIFEYPGFTCTWEHREANAHGSEGMDHGIMFYGTEGTMLMTRSGWGISPEANSKLEPQKVKGSDPQMYIDHASHWFDCLASRELPRSDIEIAHRSTTAVQLANVALKVKRRVVWDRDKEEVVNDPEANKLLTREYREPWGLPKI